MDQKVRWGWAYTSTDLGALIRSARKKKDLNQAELAERLGVTRMTISRLERGEPVALDTAVAALNECGMALITVPKDASVRVER